MRETELSLSILPGHLKDNLRVFPLGLVVDEVDLAVQDMPNDSLTRDRCLYRGGLL